MRCPTTPLAACVLFSLPAAGATFDLTADQARPAQALQRALDRARPGDTVRLAAGTYRLDRAIDLRPGVTLAGAGADTVLASAHGDNALLQLVNGGAATIRGGAVRDLTLDGAGGQNAYGVLAFGDSAPIDGLELRGLTIRHIADPRPDADPHQFGVFLTRNVTGATLAESTITDINPASMWAAGVRIAEGSSDATVTRNVIDRTGRGGILANGGSERLIIRGNVVTRSGLAAAADRAAAAGGRPDESENAARLGIELFGGSHDSVVDDNRVDRWISIDRGDRVAIRNNVVQPTGKDDAGPGFAGIELVDARHAVVSGNRVDGDNPDRPGTQRDVSIGLSVSGGGVTERVLIDGNTFTHANTFALQLQGEAGGAHQFYFRDNAFADAAPTDDAYIADQGHGLRLIDNVSDVVFDRTTSTGHAGDAVQYLDGDHGGVSGVTFAGSEGAAGVLNTPGPVAPPAAFRAGEDFVGLFVDADGRTLDPTEVLWDLGFGAPRVTPTEVLSGLYTAGLPHGHPISAVAFDLSDPDAPRMAFLRARAAPTPSAAAGGLLLGCGLLKRRR